MFVRSKVVKGRTYYQMVEGYRDELGRVRHRNVLGLGRSATVEEALRVERRRLTRLKREASRHARVGAPIRKATRTLVERLDRQIAESEARVERLKSILAGDVPSVDTTPAEIASVDTTPPAAVGTTAPGPAWAPVKSNHQRRIEHLMHDREIEAKRQEEEDKRRLELLMRPTPTIPRRPRPDPTPAAAASPADRKPIRRRKSKLDDAHLYRLVTLVDRAPDLFEEIGSPKATGDWDEARLAALRDAFDRFEARVS